MVYILARKPQAFEPGDEWHPERSGGQSSFWAETLGFSPGRGFILDGQQRLSVLYRIWRGEGIENSQGRFVDFDKVYFQVNNSRNLPFAKPPFVTVNRDFPDDRVRFTAAHELGHLLCGFPEREGAESLCHAFAGAFLLPRDAVERALMPARRKISLWELKESYGISLQAIIYRARSLGLVTGRQVRNFRETIRANGWLVTEPVEYRGNEQASRLRRLLSHAVAERIIAPERAAALAGVSTAEFLSELGEIF